MTEPSLSDFEIRTLRTMIDRHVREAENRYYQEQFETISSQPSQPNCGDHCKGECSGEVDGIPWCPMVEKPNCSTCTVPKNVTYPKWCPVIEEWVAPNYPEKTFILRKCGCLSHSGAKEYLMAPVIAELDKEIQCIEDDIPEMQNLGNINKAMQTIGVLRSCIALIRDGDFEKMEE